MCCMWTCPWMHRSISVNASANASVSAFDHVRVHRFVLVCTSLLRCLHIQLFPITLLGRRPMAGGEQLAVRLERQVGQCAALAVETWLVHAVSIKQQLQKPTTERMLLADLYTELWCGVICHFWETDRLISSRAARNRKSDRTAFRETAPRKAIENTVQYHNDGVGSVVANHHGGSGNSMVVTTLIKSTFSWLTFHLSTYKIHLNYRVVHNHN